MKLYEKMKNNENMGYCKPFISTNDNNIFLAVNEREICAFNGIAEITHYVNVSDIDFDAIADKYNLMETGCNKCAVRDKCDVMICD